MDEGAELQGLAYQSNRRGIPESGNSGAENAIAEKFAAPELLKVYLALIKQKPAGRHAPFHAKPGANDDSKMRY